MPQRPLGLDPNDPLVQTAVFGVEVQNFLEGPIGSFIMNRVRVRLAQLEKDLKKVDPFQPTTIVRIQTEISYWEQFAGWLGDAIQAGHEAVAIIDGEIDAPAEDA
jgi:hypothetical protein